MAKFCYNNRKEFRLILHEPQAHRSSTSQNPTSAMHSLSPRSYAAILRELFCRVVRRTFFFLWDEASRVFCRRIPPKKKCDTTVEHGVLLRCKNHTPASPSVSPGSGRRAVIFGGLRFSKNSRIHGSRWQGKNVGGSRSPSSVKSHPLFRPMSGGCSNTFSDRCGVGGGFHFRAILQIQNRAFFSHLFPRSFSNFPHRFYTSKNCENLI